MSPCGLVDHYPEDGSSAFLLDAGSDLTDHITSQQTLIFIVLDLAYALSETSLKLRHTLSRQTYKSKIPCRSQVR
jgi:hypothetical protein